MSDHQHGQNCVRCDQTHAKPGDFCLTHDRPAWICLVAKKLGAEVVENKDTLPPHIRQCLAVRSIAFHVVGSRKEDDLLN